MLGRRILFVVFLVFGLIGSIRISDPVGSDDLFFMHVNVNNEGTRDLDDLSVRVLFYDLGIILQTNSFDLDDGDSTGKLIFWDAPSYIKPGNYLVRITASNDDVKEVRHRIVTIA
jgi:hypothetical protein|tara:strand:- start:2769 stop:3113 length:345 start_codon:yes stop_codon:yes gene_type:complete